MLFDKFKKKDSQNPANFDSDKYVSRHEFEKLKKLVETQHNYLNNIFIFYDLESTPFLENMREISYELMKFVDNVCKKHDIEYWMDFGTLLGSIRHNDFIPWDDDLDVGMMRADYNELIKVLQSEIDENNLTNLIADFKIDKHNRKSKRWYQLSYRHPDFKAKFIGIDFFPYDYMKDYDGKDFRDRYNDALTEYYHNPDEFTLEEYMEKFYDEFNLTLEEQDYLVGGVDSVLGNIRLYTVYRKILLKRDEIFPLKRLPFGKYDFPAPKNARDHIIGYYGKNYMQIPNKIRDHGRLNKFKKEENIIELLEEGINMLKAANQNY